MVTLAQSARVGRPRVRGVYRQLGSSASRSAENPAGLRRLLLLTPGGTGNRTAEQLLVLFPTCLAVRAQNARSVRVVGQPLGFVHWLRAGWGTLDSLPGALPKTKERKDRCLI